MLSEFDYGLKYREEISVVGLFFFCPIKLRLCLFCLKTFLENHFTPLCVFGSYEKYGQRKIKYALIGK